MNTYDEAIETLKDLKESYIAVKEEYNSLQFELSYIKEALRILKIEDKVNELVKELKKEIPF